MQNDPSLSREETSWSKFHPATPEDRAAMTAMRATLEPNKGKLQGIAAREPYDAIMNRVVAPDGVSYGEDTIGGISGWWCRPENLRPDETIMHLHGGWFTFGSAQAFRNLVGHIASEARVAAFIPDYRLAPEHPFPAAIEDAEAAYRGLQQAGFRKIGLSGDSAGGGLVLLLLARLRDHHGVNSELDPVGAVALSPTTDLALTGETWVTRASADPYFTKLQVSSMVADYLVGVDPRDPAASPLYGNLRRLTPVRVHVGNDEVLLDDSQRYAERAVEAGVNATVDVWEAMVHGFLSGVGKLAASNEALKAIGAFFNDCFAGRQTQPPKALAGSQGPR